MKAIKRFVNRLLGEKKAISKSGGEKSAPNNKPSGARAPAANSSNRSTDGAKSAPNTQRRSGAGRRRPGRDDSAGESRRQDGRASESPARRGEGATSERSAPGNSQANRKRRGNRRPAGESRERPAGESRERPAGESRERPAGDPASRGRVSAGSSRVARPAAPRSRQGSDSVGTRPGGGASSEERTRLREVHASWAADSYQVEAAEDKKRFQDFDLPSEILHAVSDLGFQYCTPIQALSLEHALAGKNVAGKAQTGTGKTAAFLIAILTRYLRSPDKKRENAGCPRALVIAPTRELVIQICKDAADLGKYCGLRTLAVYGGMDYQRQRDELLAEPIDLLVATPGRLLDYVRRRIVDLSQVDTLVIDEADRMLDMGFIPDVRMIMNRLPRKEQRCTMLYSATLSQDVMRLAAQWMDAPEQVEVDSENVTTETITQVVYVVTASEKFTVLYNLLQRHSDRRILVFCNRKSTTEGVVNKLNRLNIACDMLSGDVNQNRRLRVLEDFRAGKSRVVIATDVAGRGIHVDDVGFVVNYDFPYEAEDYVHRIGRTGRAGQEGTAISFADEDESFIIPDIEKFIGEPLKCTLLMGDDPLMAEIPKPYRAQRAAPPAVRERAPESAKPQPAAEAAPDKPEGETDREPAPSAETPVPPAASSRADAPQPAARIPRKAQEPQRRPESRPLRKNPPAAAPGGSAAQRKPRFSDEWIPGE